MTFKKSIFCKHTPKSLITYQVDYTTTTYAVCENCEKIPCFLQYVIRKTPYKE